MEIKNEHVAYEKFVKTIIFWGRITLLLALVASFIPPLYLYVAHGIIPTTSNIIKAFSMIASTIVVSWIVEPIAYFPIIGITGTYMSWLAGNISNMRVPVSALSQEAAGVEEGTPQGDIISTLGIGMSVIVNLVILVLGVFFGQQIIASLPPNIQTAFKYLLPAVFGAVLAAFSMRDWALGLFALIMAFVLTSLKFPFYIVLPVCVFGTIAVGIIKFNRNKKTTKEAQK
jgi:hypothetical protein